MGIPNDLTTLFLTPEEAALFVQYQKRYTFMKLLESVGAFDLKSAHITIHFDSIGGVGSVDVNKHYRLPGQVFESWGVGGIGRHLTTE